MAPAAMPSGAEIRALRFLAIPSVRLALLALLVEKKLDLYVRLLKGAAALATARQDDEFRQKAQELTAISYGELQVVASPQVDAALVDTLRIINSFHSGKIGSADVYGTLCKLAIACRQDSIQEFQLDPKQQEEF